MDHSAAYKHLDAFAGQWSTRGTIRATADHPEINVAGSDRYEWLPGGFFMLHSVDVRIGDDRNQTTEIIGFDSASNSYHMQYFDNKGNSGVMKGTFLNGTWTFAGDSLRFTGQFSEDGNALSGAWEQQVNGAWIHFMDINLVKET